MLNSRQLEAIKPSLKAKGLEVDPRAQLRNFMALKSKIIHTDELIRRYQEKVSDCEVWQQELREAQSKVTALNQGMVGLRAEMQAMHEENDQLKADLQLATEQLEHSSNIKVTLEVEVGQLNAHIEHLQTESDCEILRRERNTLREEKERIHREYVQLKKEFDAYKLASHMDGDVRERMFKQPIRRRRSSTASSCSSPPYQSTICSPPYTPVISSPPYPPIINSFRLNRISDGPKGSPLANTHLSANGSLQNGRYTESNDVIQQNGRCAESNGPIQQNGRCAESNDVIQQNGRCAESNGAIQQNVRCAESNGAVQQNGMTNGALQQNGRCAISTENIWTLEQNSVSQIDLPSCGLPLIHEATDHGNVVGSAQGKTPLEDTVMDNDLSCSETSSECSESSLSSLDDLADYLNSNTPSIADPTPAESPTSPSMPPACEDNHKESLEDLSMEIQQELPPENYDDSFLSVSSSQLKQASSDPEALKQTSSSPEALKQTSSDPEALKQASSVPEALKQASSDPEALKQASSVPEALKQASSVPEVLKQTSSDPEALKQASSVPEVLKQTSSVPEVLKQGTTAPLSMTIAGPSSEVSERKRKRYEPTSSPKRRCSAVNSEPEVVNGNTESGAAEEPVSSYSPPVSSTVVSETASHEEHAAVSNPDLVSAEADTASSDDSDSDISFVDLNNTLSPLPPSPHHHLKVISPLPPSPPPHGQLNTISPLPLSPAHTGSTHIISPLPPSPHDEPLSPLPPSPNTTSQHLLQFANSAPMGLQSPKPCSNSTSSPSIATHPISYHRGLRTSNSSPFSPPCKLQNTPLDNEDLMDDSTAAGSKDLMDDSTATGSEDLIDGSTSAGSEDLMDGSTSARSEDLMDGSTAAGSEDLMDGSTSAGSEDLMDGSTAAGSEDLMDGSTSARSEDLMDGSTSAGSKDLIDGSTAAGSKDLIDGSTAAGSEDLMDGSTAAGREDLMDGSTSAGSKDLIDGSTAAGSKDLIDGSTAAGSEDLMDGSTAAGREDLIDGSTSARSEDLMDGSTSAGSEDLMDGSTAAGSKDLIDGSTAAGSEDLMDGSTAAGREDLIDGSTSAGSEDLMDGSTSAGSEDLMDGSTAAGSEDLMDGSTSARSEDLMDDSTAAGSEDLMDGSTSNMKSLDGKSLPNGENSSLDVAKDQDTKMPCEPVNDEISLEEAVLAVSDYCRKDTVNHLTTEDTVNHLTTEDTVNHLTTEDTVNHFTTEAASPQTKESETEAGEITDSDPELQDCAVEEDITVEHNRKRRPTGDSNCGGSVTRAATKNPRRAKPTGKATPVSKPLLPAGQVNPVADHQQTRRHSSEMFPPLLEATPSHNLPSYQLRSRNIEFWEVLRARKGGDVANGRARKGGDVANGRARTSTKDILAAATTRRVTNPSVHCKSSASVLLESDQGTCNPIPSHHPMPKADNRMMSAPGLTKRKPLRTDGATGQWEDQTPLNSPKPSDRDTNSEPASSISPLNPVLHPHSSTGHPPHPHFSGNPFPPAMLPLLQQELTMCMKCVLPLPPWLVKAMIKVQSCNAHTQTHTSSDLRKRKRKNPREPIRRQNIQKSPDYTVLNLERLVCGHLHLSTIITMFTDSWNIPSPDDFIKATIKFFLEHYHPRIEHVLCLYHEQCDAVRANPVQLDPSESSFPPPLIRPDCQLVALFAHICRMHTKMSQLLPELTKALYQAILSPKLMFHTLAAMCRMFVSLCRLQGDPERVQLLLWDLLRKPLAPNELLVIVGMASVWPSALGRKSGVKLFERNQIVASGLEQQALSYTLEVIAISLIKKHGDQSQSAHMTRNLHVLCKWNQCVYPKTVQDLARVLVEILTDSKQVYIENSPSAPIPWRRPCPSQMAFKSVHCLRMLAWHQGWVWTNDTLIRTYLWPLLRQWNGSVESVREATVICILRLIGFISPQGLLHDPHSSSIQQLHRVLLSLLQTPTHTLPIQLAAADSLLELCPCEHPKAQEAAKAITAWVKGLVKHRAGLTLAHEFHIKLLQHERTR